MRVFKDKALQEKFDLDGFVKISLADIDTVYFLRALYKEIQPESYKGFSSTIYNPDMDLKANASKKIFETLKNSVNTQFENYRPLGCSFLCKSPGQEGFLPVHQDWTIVDERKHYSMTIWMPLVNITEENGILKVLRGSHRFSTALRSPSIPGVFQKLSSEIYNQMEAIPVMVGEAIVLNHALLHASTANLSNSDRVVATFGLVPESAQLRFYHRNEKGMVEKYEIEDNFFLTYNNIGSSPSFGTKVDEFSYNCIEWNTIDLEVALKNRQNQLNATSMKPLFTDKQVQEFYNKNGYAKFKILDDAEVKTLLDYYYEQELADTSGKGFSMSMEIEDKAKVAQIRTKIYEIALPKAMEHFIHAKAIAGSYVVKDYNPVCIVPPHQDWTFADNEGEYYSVTCWIPLIDTTIENGAMGVMRGSHLMLNNIRCSPSPQVPTPLMDHQFSIFPYLEMVEMKAGEALVFDHRTFHASTPNTTQQKRVAIGLGFTQADAKICHYTMKNNGKYDTLLKYYVDDAFLLKYDNSSLSKMFDVRESIEGYEIVDEIPFELNAPSMEALVAMLSQANNVLNPELSSYMAQLFGFDTKLEEPQQIMEEQKMESSQEVLVENKPYKGAYTPMNILREIKLRLSRGKN